MSRTQWTGQISVEHLAHLSEATSTVRDQVHLVATDDKLILATRSENDRRYIFGSTPVRNADENHRTIDNIKTLVEAKALAGFVNTLDTDVCEITITSGPEETVSRITLSGRSLTINTSYENKRPWKGPFSESEYRADIQIDIKRFVPALDLLLKIDPGDPEHALLGISDQVICTYAWGDQDEMLLGVHPSEVYTFSAPFHTVYPYHTLRNSLSAFDTDSPIRVKLASAEDPSNWAVGGQAKFEAVGTEYELILWMKPQYVPTAASPPKAGQRLLRTFRDQDKISETDLRWAPDERLGI